MKSKRLSHFDLEVRNGLCNIDIIQHSDTKEMVSEDIVDDTDANSLQVWWEIVFETCQYETGADFSNKSSFVIYKLDDLNRLSEAFQKAIKETRNR